MGTCAASLAAGAALSLAGCGDGAYRLIDAHPLVGLAPAGSGVPLRLVIDGPGGAARLPVLLDVWQGLQHLRTERHVVLLPSTAGQRQVAMVWEAPGTPASAGYGLEISLAGAGQRVATAVDVGTDWTEKPRYGFLTDFTPLNLDDRGRYLLMAQYHLDALQFYDWMPSDADYVPQSPLYTDPLGRETSLAAVTSKIALAQQFRMAPMAYAAVYGSPVAFYQEHPEWALYTAAGQPERLGENFLVIMDPAPGSPWTQYIQGQYRDMLRELAFAGIHLDQYGFPQTAYSAGPRPQVVDVAGTFAPFIEATAASVAAVRPGGRVDFNNVNAWPLAQTAPVAGNAVVYIEVWPPHTRFRDLQGLIASGRSLSGGKAVVLAAYVGPESAPSVLLTDAVIFASGGYHLELGEGAALLTGAYFPDYQAMPAALAVAVRRYYDHIVRYQDLLFASDLSGGPAVALEGAAVSDDGAAGAVWAWSRTAAARRLAVVHLVNLVGLESDAWNAARSNGPHPQSGLRVHVPLPARSACWLDPDGPNAAPQPLPLHPYGGGVSLTLPRLHYWAQLVLQW